MDIFLSFPRLSHLIVHVGSMVAGFVWYWVLQNGILRALNPLIPRMTPQPATILAHLLFAAVLTRTSQSWALVRRYPTAILR